jgi:hypothetical protein
VLALSAGALWWVQARHLYYPGLNDHWVGWGGFPADRAPATLLCWTWQCFVGIGHYGATGLGVPLLLLGAVGVAALWRRSRSLAVLLSGPLALGYAAALLGVYPMADRTVFFATPCLWLLAAAGLGTLARFRNGRLAWAALVGACVLVVPQAVRTVKYLAVARPRCDYRGALTYVKEHQAEGDLCWVSHPEVYEVYYGTSRPCLGVYTPANEVIARVRGKRLWVVSAPATSQIEELQVFPEVLRSAGLTVTKHETFVGLDVVLYEPEQ